MIGKNARMSAAEITVLSGDGHGPPVGVPPRAAAPIQPPRRPQAQGVGSAPDDELLVGADLLHSSHCAAGPPAATPGRCGGNDWVIPPGGRRDAGSMGWLCCCRAVTAAAYRGWTRDMRHCPDRRAVPGTDTHLLTMLDEVT